MFGAVLLRSESEASSQIENLTASARAIAEAELLGVQAKRNAEMIVANTAAIQAALNLFATVDTAAILAMHRALMAARGPRTTKSRMTRIERMIRTMPMKLRVERTTPRPI